MKNSSPASSFSRRDILKTILYSAPLTLFSPGGLFAQGRIKPLFPPRVPGEGDLLRVAHVGISNRGRDVFKTISQMEGKKLTYVAFAEVNPALPDPGFNSKSKEPSKYADVPRFTDYRKMLEDMHGEIDALVICTPDHSHFAIAMHAMLLGKHVFVEKPLANTVLQCRLLKRAAEETGVVTQMGNQGHSGGGTLQFLEWVKKGLVSDVARIDAWMTSSRRWHGWKIDDYPTDPLPKGFDWDMWLNRVPFRPYSIKLNPGNWRSWFDFGNGALGDWGAHILDGVMVGLKLGMPYEISTKLIGPNKFIFPQGSVITFKFKARDGMPPVELRWFDGRDNHPPTPPDYDAKMGNVGIFIYSKDFVQQGRSHGAPYRVVPNAKWKEFAPSLTQVKPSGRNHWQSFIDACRGTDRTTSPFQVSAELSELLCLGCIGQRLGGTLAYDAEKMEFPGNPEATKLLHGLPARPGWESYDSFQASKSGPTPGYPQA